MTASAELKPSQLLYGLRLAGLIALFLLYVLPHLLSKWVLGRSGWTSRFLRHATFLAGVRTSIDGKPIEPHSLIIANHTSWLDILLLGGFLESAFVSKAEVKSTPLVGWLADQNRTLYIERSARRDSHGQVRRIREALSHNQPLAVFPEGTTGDGRHLLHFRSTLLEAVSPPPSGVAVRPVAIDFGDHADLVGWHSGEPGLSNFRRVLGHRGTVGVTIRLLQPLVASDDRKVMARHARKSIGAALSSLAAPEAL